MQQIINANNLPDHTFQELIDCEEAIKKALAPISNKHSGNIFLGGVFSVYLAGLKMMNDESKEDLIEAYGAVIECMKLNLELEIKNWNKEENERI